MAYSIPPQSLHREVIEKLKERNIAEFYRDCLKEQGIIELPWIRRLTRGAIRSPDVNKMQVLYEQLTQRELL